MKKRRLFAVTALCLVLCLSLSGCKLFSASEELIVPPRPQGELSKIQDALGAVVSEDYTLKYPTAGEYRSAIVSVDLTGNGVNDAVAFYSTMAENLTSMHISVATKRDGEWIASPDISVPASGVERVEFTDLNGDGVNEIIVGWSVLGNAQKLVAVYSFDGVSITQRMQEKYTRFLCTDLDTNQTKELFLLYLNTTEKTATARLLELTDSGITEYASCKSDGNIQEYSAVSEQKMLGGRPAVYIDGIKAGTTVTEVLYLDGGRLVNPFCVDGETKLTERPSVVTSKDMTADGVPDIPMLSILPGYEQAAENDRLYTTKWCSFDGKNLVVTLTAVMNYTDGCYFTVPKELDGLITVDKDATTRTRTVYLYDPKTGARTEELFRVRTVSLNNWESSPEDFTDWQQLYSTESLVYAVKISDYAGEKALSFEKIKECFKLI